VKETDLQFLVAASRRILAREGCESRVAGHVSARAEEGDGFWVSPFGYFDETTPDMVIKLDFELNRLEGDWTPSPAVEFHAALYTAREDIGSVIHTHSHELSKFVTRARVIGQYNVASVLFHDEQVLFDREDMKNHTMGAGMVRMLGDKHVLLMKNHGAVVVAESLERATIEAMMLEKCAEYHLAAEAIGGTEFPLEEVVRGKGRYQELFLPNMWEANFRRLRKSDPDLFELLE
jgi:ribulose-5-phosphate 4-epimerase/fuculose-1-phosphate aldolase